MFRPRAALLALLLASCSDASDASPTAIDRPAVPWATTEFPKLPEDVTDVPEERVELGRLLFFDPIVSVDRETACASCHSEFWGLSDQLPIAVGHGAGSLGGPFREGTNFGRRNTPTLFNIGFRETLLWDGGESSLEAQAVLPLLAKEELDLDPDVLVDRLAQIPKYVQLFAAAFPADPTITIDNFAAAIAALERTFVSNRALYDAYVRGHVGAFDEELVDGMFRFAEMGCDECHSPPLFESEIFADRNVPPAAGVVDDGLAEITGLPSDRSKFRTPPLRNAHATEPFFHNGSVADLESAVEHELEQSGRPFTDDDVHLIERFLHRALRDTTRAAARPRAVPSGLQVPEDRLP
ncbi:MAG: cytochrome-c peroxidase [Myxococcales bacterium]|nr:cytochrome-c peroxidase [Deltaproteobacteria bacterium]NND29484.1 cytochrome-c peroxidase [Myxococcales bacterium]MBT8481058.1 cytochrome-c peroxidase [Deltaproteobacteria bacterium]NNK07617.1 cytochrome-c peroxidase [Myxococcales bacterium]NNK44609.1 cytochrome-c peroxidase [Myxococcales bacterium]